MGIPGKGTAFFSILKVFLFLVVLYFIAFPIFLMTAIIDVEISMTEAMIANIVPAVSKLIFYACGIINGINIGKTE